MKFFKNKFFITSLFLIIAAAGAYFIFNKKPKDEYTTAIIERGNLIQTVSETGMVKANKEMDLNFTTSGRIAHIFVGVGDKVKKDQILAELDSSDLLLKEKEAAANLQVAQANLAKLLAGATASELAVSQASLDQAKTAYVSSLNESEKIKNTVNENIAQAEKSLNDLYLTSGGTITSYQQAVKNYISVSYTAVDVKIPLASNALDSINTILNDNDAKYFLGAGNISLIETTKNNYLRAGTALIQAKASQTGGDVNQALADTLDALNKTFEALRDCYNLLEVSLAGSSFTQAELDAYKTAISAQQANISSGITSLQTAQNNLNDSINNLNNAIAAAKNALATAKVTGAQQIAAAQARVDTGYKAWLVAEAQLNQLKAGTRTQDINLAQAQVSQAKASLGLARNQINNNTIKALLDGTITKKNYEAGEQFSLSKPVFLLLGVNNFEIEVDVSEADITKVALNDQAEITLDAFGEDVKFTGQVNFIEPAETVIQDVIYYKVKINFDGKDKDIKSGMTANANITTAKKDNVLIMPSRAVIEKNGSGKFVRLLVSEQIEEVPVTIGLRGDNGLVEVLSGLNENDIVVTYIQQNN
ncbi:efflux RND transporter periplasmic adaptor subunit [Candidatus Falkowbacteria bacterium]|nr:efflux RND transporter periplasmic adaptor subunit [Candidatus Falkowbacteria bacterium]